MTICGDASQTYGWISYFFSCANIKTKLFTSLANIPIVLRAFETRDCYTTAYGWQIKFVVL